MLNLIEKLEEEPKKGCKTEYENLENPRRSYLWYVRLCLQPPLLDEPIFI